MPKTYVTFGATHTHVIEGNIFNGDCVAVIKCGNKTEGRDKVFELFGPKFSFEYHEDEFSQDYMSYYPRGQIAVGGIT